MRIHGLTDEFLGAFKQQELNARKAARAQKAKAERKAKRDAEMAARPKALTPMERYYANHERNKEKSRLKAKARFDSQIKGSNEHFKRLLRARIYNAIKRQSQWSGRAGAKAMSTFELIGCDINSLRVHIESRFTDGMTWDNQGCWHIDHIRPCASFDLSVPEQQRLCFHYTNLQPLWARDNLAKSDSYAA